MVRHPLRGAVRAGNARSVPCQRAAAAPSQLFAIADGRRDRVCNQAALKPCGSTRMTRIPEGLPTKAYFFFSAPMTISTPPSTMPA